MSGTKFEDSLEKWKNNDLMGIAYANGVNDKTSFSDTEKKKVSDSIRRKRIHGEFIKNVGLVEIYSQNLYYSYPTVTRFNLINLITIPCGITSSKVLGEVPTDNPLDQAFRQAMRRNLIKDYGWTDNGRSQNILTQEQIDKMSSMIDEGN